MSDEIQLKYKHKILILDDETGILRAVNRVLRKLSNDITTIDSPIKALEIVKNQKPPFSLIISDQRMPEMKGAEFLKYAKEISPYTIRFLLTGYTDMDALVDAINKGGIHRFIAKPWEDKDFLQIVIEGLKQYELILENKRLLGLVAKQNKELNQAKTILEKKVNERTKQISNKNTELIEINNKLTESLFRTIRAIGSLVESINPDLAAHGQRVSEISLLIGQEFGLSKNDLRTLEIASLLHDVGRLKMTFPIIDPDLLTDTELAQNEKEIYLTHPIKGEEIIKFIPQLQKCAKVIRNHHENYDGSGFPDGLEEKNIPFESRIIAIANAYDRLHISKKQRYNAVEKFLEFKNTAASDHDRSELIEASIVHYLQQNAFILFDPDILKVMLAIIKNKKLSYKIEMEVYPEDLEPGDIIVNQVYTHAGNILFEKDTLINNKKIEKMHQILKNDALRSPIKVIQNFGSTA